jgi:hypothetical protein
MTSPLTRLLNKPLTRDLTVTSPPFLRNQGGGGRIAAPIPTWANVELLLNFNDDSAGNGTSDDQNTWAMFYSSDANVQSTVKKFGAKALRLPGTTDTANANWTALTEMQLSNQSITLEGWIRFDTALGASDRDPFMTRWIDADNDWEYWTGYWDGKLEVWGSSDGSTKTLLHSESWSPSALTWYHWAWCIDRATESSRMFVDGYQLGATYDTTGFTFYDNFNVSNLIGDYSGSASENMTGWVDDWRLCKEALYTQDFIPPGEHPTS